MRRGHIFESKDIDTQIFESNELVKDIHTPLGFSDLQNSDSDSDIAALFDSI